MCTKLDLWELISAIFTHQHLIGKITRCTWLQCSRAKPLQQNNMSFISHLRQCRPAKIQQRSYKINPGIHSWLAVNLNVICAAICGRNLYSHQLSAMLLYCPSNMGNSSVVSESSR